MTHQEGERLVHLSSIANLFMNEFGPLLFYLPQSVNCSIERGPLEWQRTLTDSVNRAVWTEHSERVQKIYYHGAYSLSLIAENALSVGDLCVCLFWVASNASHGSVRVQRSVNRFAFQFEFWVEKFSMEKIYLWKF